MKKYLIYILLSMPCIALKAQQYPMVSQYMFNGMFINPAYTGHHGLINSTLHHRSQWVGFDGAPKTSILAVDGMFKDGKNALGGIIYHDRIGARTESDFSLNYAYHIRTSESTHLSFGVRGGVAYNTGNLTGLNTWDPDVVFMENNTSFAPKAGFGAFFYADNYFAGVAVPTLFAYEKGMEIHPNITRSSSLSRHYLVSGGYVHELNNGIKIRPSVLMKYLPNAPVQADLNLNALLMNSIWAGFTFRTGESVIALFEYTSDFGVRIGYAFDYNISRVRNFSYGSHEILLGYRFSRKSGNSVSPRLF